MNPKFRELIEELEPKFRSLINMTPVKAVCLPQVMPKRGIYLFSQGTDYLYVGRTNSLKKRISNHCRPSGGHNTATFAFRIARQETGRTKVSYTQAGSRGELEKDPVFGPIFIQAKARLASLDIRFVEETDPTRQALLEIYAATVLEARYNDFDNH